MKMVERGGSHRCFFRELVIHFLGFAKMRDQNKPSERIK